MKRKRILVVSHDAGGAEIISAYVKHFYKHYDFFCLVSGPAEKVFLNKKIADLKVSFVTETDPVKVLSKIKPELVLTATSWITSVEKDFITASKKKGIRTAVYLDHWINYRERFGYPDRDWKKNLPDEIWVGDKEAFVMAKRLKFPNVKMMRNEYFIEIKEKIKKLTTRKKTYGLKTLLFISEPISVGAQKKFGNPRYWGFTEHEVLENICVILAKKPCWQLVVRKHPSDAPDTYDQIIKKFVPRVSVVYSSAPDLVADIVVADLVLGMDSVALVIGLLAKKKVISYIPGRKKKCSLPFKAIFKVKTMAGLRLLLGLKKAL